MPTSAVQQAPATEAPCARCGAPLASDQDWCFECGAADTARIHVAADWRIPLAIVTAVVVLAVVALVALLASLSDSANQSAAAAVAAAPANPAAPATPTAGTPTTGTPTAGTPPAQTTPTAFSTWPKGVTGYTVVLDVIASKAAATAKATKIAAAGIPVGLLYSSDYSSMTPGDWIVFSGTYTASADASTAAAQLQAKGETGAYSYSVVPRTP